ncbi:molybdate ABC transporter substrate-binding protein [Macrococcoides canis]|uniref:molybdate ABC transporter substrate-binding protein n=1 Tax=Macrococcoides canis TaxID=1855823 RepID=UPI001B8BC5C9|nr:molybdate ABC transporter substrate-binding protein [Macrococcus canis]QUR94497.1 molybdate ABC transporter substrate-binding protein [Macrococcus canis]UTH06986.1 molybdate ABC transporter substrate-binding protein [Macrococcus canis]
MKKLFVILSAVLLLSACNQTDEIKQQKDKKIITVSAAASLKDALNEIEQKYEKEHQTIDLKFNYGASGTLAQQIKSGAPVDLFISAAEDKVDMLVEDNKINKEDKKSLLKNHLVLISNSPINSVQNLTSNKIEKIALGNPDLVPAGAYGKQMLENAGLYQKLKNKCILTKDVRQVLTYVETGNVDAGIVYASDVKSSEKIKYSFTIQDTMHDKIIYPAAIIKDTQHKEDAQQFFNYVAHPDTLKIFEKYGFDSIS